jgi:hypothetical protein
MAMYVAVCLKRVQTGSAQAGAWHRTGRPCDQPEYSSLNRCSLTVYDHRNQGVYQIGEV